MICQIVLGLCAAFLIGDTSALRPRIHGGVEVEIQDYPYQVSIQYGGDHLCGGSIISDRHILTAAHCMVQYWFKPPYDEVAVVTGTTIAHEGGVHRTIANITFHPECGQPYDECYAHDIAIITLKDKIVFDEYQQKIDLATSDYEVGSVATLTGWGKALQGPYSAYPDKLQMFQPTIVSLEECRKKVGDEVLDIEVCAFHSKGHGACHADSGSPLVVDDEVIAIAAWIFDGFNCASGQPDVYTSVYKHLDFIKSVIEA